jgi:Na+-translocating ferredoxin:NAD+ oxidoreductase RnfA subunit
MTASPLVDWSLFGHVVLVALLAGVGVVIAFSLGLVALSIVRDAQRRLPLRIAGVVIAVVMTGLLVWALWWGFQLITNKS